MKFPENNRLLLRCLALLLALLTILPLAACGPRTDNEGTTGENAPGATSETAGGTTEPDPALPELVCTVRTVEFEGAVSTYTETQKSYLSDAAKNATNYAGETPVSATTRWNASSDSEQL